MRLTAKRQEPEGVDVCSKEGFKAFMDINPNLLLLVSSDNCGKKCDTLRDVANRLADEKSFPIAEVDFKAKPEGVCASIESELKARPGELILFKGGKEVARKKGTFSERFDERNVKDLLSR